MILQDYDVFCPLSACLAIGSEMRLADAKQPLEMHSVAPGLVPKKKPKSIPTFIGRDIED